MARPPRSVDQAIARFDELSSRLDGHRMSPTAQRIARGAAATGRKLANIGIALGLLMIATIAFGLALDGIGLTGLFIVALAVLAILLFFGMRSSEPPAPKAVTEATPNREVVRILDATLHRRRAALPAPAARRVDAIKQQLPLLESRLAEVDALDPLAQDARRLMGKHLPELIDRYEKVPAAYRNQRDGEGLTVDERLVASLDAANAALTELGGKLSKQDLDAFETQGRFIESRYRDGSDVAGS